MIVLGKIWACVLKDFRIDASYRVSFAIDVVDGLLMFAVYGVLAETTPTRASRDRINGSWKEIRKASISAMTRDR